MAQIRDFITEQVRIEGRERLARLLPQARALMQNQDTAPSAAALIGYRDALGDYVREDNFDGLTVYGDDVHGWWADLIFKEVPKGVSDSIGTPVATPCRTKAEAEHQALGVLVMVLFVEQQAKEGNTPVALRIPTFLLFGNPFPLNPAWMDQITASVEADQAQVMTVELLTSHLEKTVTKLFPNGFDPAAMIRLSSLDASMFLSLIHRAAHAGMTSYPPPSKAH